MDDILSTILITSLLWCVVLVIVSLSVVDAITSITKQDICKQLAVTTESYVNCNATSIDKIILQIKKNPKLNLNANL